MINLDNYKWNYKYNSVQEYAECNVDDDILCVFRNLGAKIWMATIMRNNEGVRMLLNKSRSDEMSRINGIQNNFCVLYNEDISFMQKKVIEAYEMSLYEIKADVFDNTPIGVLKAVLNVFDQAGFKLSAYSEDGIECGISFENWTPGGVDMQHMLDFRLANDRTNIFDVYNISDKIKQIANGFDVDEEIDVYREDESYKSNFTYRDSIKDFESWQETLNQLSAAIEDVIKEYAPIYTEKDFEYLGVTMQELVDEIEEIK